MPKCEKCGNEYDELLADYEFANNVDSSVTVWYDSFNRNLCGECAVEAYENGEYFETCECCGKSFYPEDEYWKFKNAIEPRLLDADMYFNGNILCADCAVKANEEWLEETKDLLDD